MHALLMPPWAFCISLIIGVHASIADAQSSGDASGINNNTTGVILSFTTPSTASIINFGTLASGATSSVQTAQVCNTSKQAVEVVLNLTGFHPENFTLDPATQILTVAAAGSSSACETITVTGKSPDNLEAQVNDGEKKYFSYSAIATAGVKGPYSADGNASIQMISLMFTVTIDKTSTNTSTGNS